MWRWYAVFCRPGQDHRAELHFHNQGFETFRPKVRVTRPSRRKLNTRVESLFPRYLFLNLNDLTQSWAPIRSTRGAVGLVRLGDRVPAVPDTLIESLSEHMDGDGVVDLSAGVEFEKGDKVEIMEGPFAGHRALFQARSGNERVVVLLSLLQGESRVELPRRAIRNLQTA